MWAWGEVMSPVFPSWHLLLASLELSYVKDTAASTPKRREPTSLEPSLYSCWWTVPVIPIPSWRDVPSASLQSFMFMGRILLSYHQWYIFWIPIHAGALCEDNHIVFVLKDCYCFPWNIWDGQHMRYKNKDEAKATGCSSGWGVLAFLQEKGRRPTCRVWPSIWVVIYPGDWGRGIESAGVCCVIGPKTEISCVIGCTTDVAWLSHDWYFLRISTTLHDMLDTIGGEDLLREWYYVLPRIPQRKAWSKLQPLARNGSSNNLIILLLAQIHRIASHRHPPVFVVNYHPYPLASS